MDEVALSQVLRTRDLPSYFALATLNRLKGSRVGSHRAAIFRFLVNKYGELPLEHYLLRSQKLREMQIEFEKTNKYPASCYSAVPAIDDDEYKIALLLSFVVTNHRFEILESLETFLRLPCFGPRTLLSVGFGTGYELKVAHDILPDWEVEAYDNSVASFRYASELLRFYNCSNAGLREQVFPLEVESLPDEFRNRYGRIIMCELLEHLEHPELALKNARMALHEDGIIFATMAINIAQEDHVFLYRTPDEARLQVRQAGLHIVDEFVTPIIVRPFSEEDRERIFTKGNYVCVLSKKGE